MRMRNSKKGPEPYDSASLHFSLKVVLHANGIGVNFDESGRIADLLRGDPQWAEIKKMLSEAIVRAVKNPCDCELYHFKDNPHVLPPSQEGLEFLSKEENNG